MEAEDGEFFFLWDAIGTTLHVDSRITTAGPWEGRWAMLHHEGGVGGRGDNQCGGRGDTLPGRGGYTFTRLFSFVGFLGFHFFKIMQMRCQMPRGHTMETRDACTTCTAHKHTHAC